MTSHVEDLLLAFLRDELGPAERRAVEDHVAACQACRRSLSELERLVADLRLSAPAPSIDWSVYRAELQDKLERRAAPPESRWSWRFRPIPAALAAGLVAVLLYVGAPQFGRQGGPGSEDQVPVDNAVLASQLDLISRLDLVQRLDLLEDFDVIRRLDGLERTGEG